MSSIQTSGGRQATEVSINFKVLPRDIIYHLVQLTELEEVKNNNYISNVFFAVMSGFFGSYLSNHNIDHLIFACLSAIGSIYFTITYHSKITELKNKERQVTNSTDSGE